MKFSVQPSINTRIWRMLNFFYFLIDDVIHDVICLMNLGNKYRITNFIIFRKLCFYNNLMLDLIIKLKTRVIFSLNKFLQSNQ